MIPKKKICSGCNEFKFIQKRINGKPFCSYCATKKSPPKKIKTRSKKKETQDLEYSKLRTEFLELNTHCKVGTGACTGLATEVHHKSYRGINYLNVSSWIATCRKCHKWIHENPIDARTLKLLIDND